MLRLMIQDVTLLRQDDIHVCVRWKGGATSELHLPRPLTASESRRTPQAVLDRIAGLAEQHTDEQIAEILNREGLCSGTGLTFTYEQCHPPADCQTNPRLLRSSTAGRHGHLQRDHGEDRRR